MYRNPSFLEKGLHKAKESRNENIVNQVKDVLVDLRNAANKKKIPESENPDEVYY